MAAMLYHGLRQLGLPVVCIESRQAYQALKLLPTHKTDRNEHVENADTRQRRILLTTELPCVTH
jgi:hypothetical protein